MQVASSPTRENEPFSRVNYKGYESISASAQGTRTGSSLYESVGNGVLKFQSVDGFVESELEFDSTYDSLDYMPIVSVKYLQSDAAR